MAVIFNTCGTNPVLFPNHFSNTSLCFTQNLCCSSTTTNHKL